jgi:hypothetical protein
MPKEASPSYPGLAFLGKTAEAAFLNPALSGDGLDEAIFRKTGKAGKESSGFPGEPEVPLRLRGR